MSNKAAFVAEKGAHFNIGSAPYPRPGPGQVVTRNAAVAINPIDWKMQDFGYFVKKWPTILGCDLAGEIIEVGEGVTNLTIGQRVLGFPISLITSNGPEAAFQNYTIVPAVVTTRIPDSMSFADASVLPVSIGTASLALYAPEWLGLPLPALKPKRSDQTVFIWGGSSSVGASAIQLAKASGFEVIATASKHNIDYVQSLGAKEVLDYSSGSVVEDLVALLKKTKLAGVFDAVGSSGAECATILKAVNGKGKFPSVQMPPQDLPEGIEAGQVMATDVAQSHADIGHAVYHDFLPRALLDGTFVPAPKTKIVGHGLDKLQEACDTHKAGVSATKLVVTL